MKKKLFCGFLFFCAGYRLLRFLWILVYWGYETVTVLFDELVFSVMLIALYLAAIALLRRIDRL